MDRIYNTLISLVLLLLFPVFSGAAPAFRHIGVEEGFGQSNITSIYQDALGTLWVAGMDGVATYSGVLPEDPSPIAENPVFKPFEVRSVFGEGDRYVYFCQSDNVVRYDIESGRCEAVFDTLDLKGRRLTSACVSGGYVCAASYQSIIISSENGIKSYKLPQGIGEVTSMIRVEDGSIYIGTLLEGLIRMKPDGSSEPVLDIDSKVNYLYEDSRRILWVCTRSEGLISISPDGSVRQYVRGSGAWGGLTDNFTRCICEDSRGDMWIGMMFGLDRLDVSSGKISHFGKSDDIYFGMRNLTVECLLSDRSGKIWCGSYYTGLSYFEPEDNAFSIYPVGKSEDVSASIFVDVVSDSNGDIWAATTDKGLYHYDISSGTGHFFQMSNSDIPGDNIKSLVYDSETNMLWAGMFMGGVACIDVNTRKILRVTFPKDGKNTEDTQIVHSLSLHGDHVYAGTYAGVYRIGRHSRSAELVLDVPRVFNVVATDSLLYVVIGQTTFQVYDVVREPDFSLKQRLSMSLKNNRVTVMKPDFNDRIWMGTTHGGAIMYDPESDAYATYDEAGCGIADNMITALCALPGDRVLLGTTAGLTLLDAQSGRCENFSCKRGFPLGSLKNGCVWRRDDGTVFCGGTDAFAVFADSIVTRPIYSPNVFFSSLSVNDREVYAGDESGILDRNLPYSEAIVIGHRSRILDFHIGTDNSSEFMLEDFQYRLLGYDEEWKPLQGTSVRYMNLPAGEYELTLRTRPDKLFEGPRSVSLAIRVHPPLYASVYAYVLYVILLICGTAFVLNYFYSKKQLMQTIEFERMDKKRQEKVNQWKLVFFTNISHELRTPLTLITGQLDIISGYELPESVNGFFQNVRRNALRLQSLVNELIDFRKQEQGHMSLKTDICEIVSYLKSVCEDFYEYGKIRGIEFVFESDTNCRFCEFDRVQLQKVFYNLISNAFKHTEKGGSIKVSLQSDAGSVQVCVSDTGHGIDSSKFGYIFERYYHEGIDATDTGVGIGLSLSKGIVELHGGTISVESQVGVGSVFTVNLPLREIVQSKEESLAGTGVDKIGHPDVVGTKSEPFSSGDPDASGNPDIVLEEKEKPVLLIVEDDREMQNMLKYTLSGVFDVILASNGRDGLDAARKHQPALIVSDVMMPEMSGREMCSILKSEFETCHIPVILLTALSSSENVLEGLDCGADDYIAKPFDIALLKAKCQAMVRNRKLLYEKYINREYRDGMSGEPAAVKDAGSLDERFASSVMELINSRIDDSSLGVNMMCVELGLSRTLLFLKIKGVFGKTPVELVQGVRMSRAAKLLKENPEMKISEIADSLGINSLQYFGKLFKLYYGVTPTEFRHGPGVVE